MDPLSSASPPLRPPNSPYPVTYGPASSALRSPPLSPMHQDYYTGYPVVAGTPNPATWVPYSPPSVFPMSGDRMGSTFFLRGSGTQRLAERAGTAARIRKPLPIPSGATSDIGQPGLPLSLVSGGVVNPRFTEETSFSPPHQPQTLPKGARPSASPPLSSSRPKFPVGSGTEDRMVTKVPLGNSGSLMIHSGFWQILQATGSRFVGAASGESLSPPALEEAATRPAMASTTGRDGIKKKRISIDMIGRPEGFTHLVHASDVEQAHDLLHRWHADRVGKLGTPAWSLPIKEAARARAAARGVAEVQEARAAEEHANSLKVVNGLPDSVISNAAPSSVGAVEDADIERTAVPVVPVPVRRDTAETVDTVIRKPSSPLAMNPPANAYFDATTRFNPGAKARAPLGEVGTSLPSMAEEGPLSFDTEILHVNRPFPLPRSFMPSLTTIEKAVSTKIFFETYYHSILRGPRPREVRLKLLEQELTRLQISDAERRNVREAWRLSETDYLRELRRKVGVGSFEKVKVVGHGAFGVVSLVREKGTGELYAMKQLRKTDMLKKGQEGHVRAERDLLATAANNTMWTVRLAYSFQDIDHLYLVMTYMPGGDLLTLLIEKDVFEESFAKFYFAEMVLAVEETHKVLGAIHRDIKPDNFLFDKEGHIAISDFGLATDFHWAHDGAYFEAQRRELLFKHGIDIQDGRLAPATARFDDKVSEDDTPGSVLTWRDRQRRKLAYSIVGTNNYMCIDVIRNLGYDQACDWWSLGIILFEMLYGYPPFVSKTRQQTRSKILHWRQHLRFPAKPRVSREAQDFITSLICEKEDRLGSRSGYSTMRPNSMVVQRRSAFFPNGVPVDHAMLEGAEEVKAHPWFRGVDFKNIRKKTPPFVPKLASETDTRYFEEGIPDEPLPAPEVAPGVPAPDETKDPMLRDRVHGKEILDVRKQLAFQNWTFKGQKNRVYDPRDGLLVGRARNARAPADPGARGRTIERSEGGSGFGRSLSI